jgi:hypothetical protein
MVIQLPDSDQTEMQVKNILIAVKAGIIDSDTAEKLLAQLEEAPTEK